MSSYFRTIPNFDYVNRDPNSKNISDYVTVKNIFKRGKIREEIFGDTSYFDLYNVSGDDRPDIVAYQIYGDEALDWVILLSNNIQNLHSEWPLTQDEFDKHLINKYGDYNTLYNGSHHYETLPIVNSSGVTVLTGGLVTTDEWKTNGNWIETNSSKILSIYAGNGSQTSTTVTVELYGSGFLNLKVGDEVGINNISQDSFNGNHVVTELTTINELSAEEYFVKSFTYELASAPEIPNPTLSFVIDPSTNLPVGAHVEESRLTIVESALKGNAYYFEYYDTRLQKLIQVPSNEFIIKVSNYEYETILEEKKRTIYALKPNLLQVLLEDVDRYMPYETGGEQYINPTLKRGDNIRLYE
jgi:hypothetical protein